MSLLAVLIFIGIFAVLAPLLVVWSGAGKATSKKQVIAALDSALGAGEKDKSARPSSTSASPRSSAIFPG